jgi:hypothetical protein
MIHTQFHPHEYNELSRLAKVFSDDLLAPQPSDWRSFQELYGRFQSPEGIGGDQIPAACQRLQAAIDESWEGAWEADHAQTSKAPLPANQVAELSFILFSHQFGARVNTRRFAWYFAYALDALTPAHELPADWHRSAPSQAEFDICLKLLRKQALDRNALLFWAILAWVAGRETKKPPE